MNISTKSKENNGYHICPDLQKPNNGTFEFTLYDLCRDKFGEDLGNFIFENWSRFLDVCETLLE